MGGVLFRSALKCGVGALAWVVCSSGANAQSNSAFDWTGYYIGSHIGTSAVSNNWNSASGDLGSNPPFPGNFTSGGLLSGMQFGYNRQVGRWVYGVETDVSLADIEGPARCAVAVFTCNAQIDALGTVTGRIGFAYGSLLIYGKAGGAWAHERYELVASPGRGLGNYTVQGKGFRLGWTLGAGAEYAFTSNLSARAEYNYLDFDGNVGLFGSAGGENFGLHQNVHLIKLGLNYKLGRTSPFNGWPPVAGGTPTPGLNWTGFYVGVHGGGAFGTTNWKSADGTLATFSTNSFPGTGTMDGMIAGAQAGYNRQFGSWVLGVEADVSWANLDGYARCATQDAPAAAFTCHTRIDAMGTVTGRLGMTYGNALIYSKGGLAWAHEKNDIVNAGTSDAFRSSSTRIGYTVGSGVEYAFSPAWSGRAEYRYMDFGTRTTAMTDQANGNVSNVAVAQRAHLLTLGLNYKLGGDSAHGAMAADLPASVFKAPPALADWEIDAGTRYWYSNGKMQQDLYSNLNPRQLNSRLIYGDMNGHSLEAFVRFDHRSGLFIKGNFGAGTLVNGKLFDEDQPPDNNPYSNTLSQMKDGGLRFGSIDVGYNLLSGPAGKLGPYVGYRYFYQLGRGFGCAQVGPGDVCVPTVPTNTVVLTETEQWRGVAVGLNSKMAITNRLTFEADAAFLPYVDRAGVDNHWLRASINPGPETGRAWGAQIEGILTDAVTRNWSVGAGGRYWYFATVNGESQFPAREVASPIKFTSDRYGGFLQASYKFGGSDRQLSETLPPANWTGVYAGMHLGAGFGNNRWSDPFPAPVTGDETKMGGALGGLQLGANYQVGQIVVGAEISGSLAQLDGSNTCYAGIPNTAVAALECENRTHGIGTLTGRVGYAMGRSLFYARAGGAMTRDTYTLNTNTVPAGAINIVRATNVGWTAGGGIEHALTQRWSVNAEYKYIDLGTRTPHFDVPAALTGTGDNAVKSNRQLLTLGVNYKFAGPAN